MSSNSCHPIGVASSPSGVAACSAACSAPCSPPRRPRPRPRPPRRRRLRRDPSPSPFSCSSAAGAATAAAVSSATVASAVASGPADRVDRRRGERAGLSPSRSAASAAAATPRDASRNPNSGLTSLAGISGIGRCLEVLARPMPMIFMMSVNSSATAMRSDEVLGRKLMTSQRTPTSCRARMAGAKSPSPETMTAMSIRSLIRNRSTTSSMSRFALTRPSPNLRMSLWTTL